MRYEELEEADARRLGLAGMASAAALAGTIGAKALPDRDHGMPLAPENAEYVFGTGDWFGPDNLAPEESEEDHAKDALMLAKTMWGEARQHGVSGMNAVGHVIANRARAEKPSFGLGIKGVALKKNAAGVYQFSCWNPRDPNRAKLANIDNLPKDSPDYKAWQEAKKLAVSIMNGKSADPTRGATFYHTTAIKPYWAAPEKYSATVGNHIFYTGAKLAQTKNP